ncbi:MAG: hypothetical protein GEU96_12290 [Propionibacteriales bacterium]|nr:hypothetical protein [Propionibacteriales bacterium]
MTNSDDATTAAAGGVRPIRAVLTRLTSSLRRRRAALKTTAVALMLPLPLAFSAPPADLLGRFDASTGALSDLVRPFTSLLQDAEDSDDGVRQVPMDLGTELDSPRVDSGLGGDLRRPISGINSFDMPAPVMRAYRAAAATLARTDPSCRIDWALLAGIGRVESNHGQFGGSTVQPNGSTAPHIIGLPLNGAPGVATIRDSDGGRLDNDKVWDRAVGPMQFIPTTWASVAADGDNDGVRDPHDIDDAALAAGAYLCAGSGDLSTREGAEAAVFRYNHSESYVSLVLAIAEKYRNGVAVVPAGPAPVGNGKAPNLKVPPATTPSGDSGSTWKPKKKSGGSSTSPSTPTNPPTGDPTNPPSGDPSDPPTTEPPPSPAPKLTTCGDGWCYDGLRLGLGLDYAGLLDQPWEPDFDGYDGVTRTNTLREELNYFANSKPTVGVGRDGNNTLTSLNDKPYTAPEPRTLDGRLKNGSAGLQLVVGEKTWTFAPLSSGLPARDYDGNKCVDSVSTELEGRAGKTDEAERQLQITAVVDEGSTATVVGIVTTAPEAPACGSDGQPVPTEEPSPTPTGEESTQPEG